MIYERLIGDNNHSNEPFFIPWMIKLYVLIKNEICVLYVGEFATN